MSNTVYGADEIQQTDGTQETHAVTTEPLAEEKTIANHVAQVHGEI